jgi:hypothetical protein
MQWEVIRIHKDTGERQVMEVCQDRADALCTQQIYDAEWNKWLDRKEPYRFIIKPHKPA